MVDQLCRCCSKFKPLGQFNKNKGNRSGHDYICRQCKKDNYRLNSVEAIKKVSGHILLREQINWRVSQVPSFDHHSHDFAIITQTSQMDR